MLLDRDEAKKLTDKILSYSKADSAEVSLVGSNSQNVRFAVNTVSTCGAIDSIEANITSNIGKKSGTISITSVDDETIERGVRQSEEIAVLSPEQEEFMPLIEKQDGYLDVKEFFEDTHNLTPKNISEQISYTLDKAISNDLQAAGYFENESAFNAIANTNGLFAYHKNTIAGFASTMRTMDGKGSSKIDRAYADVNFLDVRKFSDTVMSKAALSKDPKRHEPGKYVTILDSQAVADILNNLSYYMSKRGADEGRSFFSEKNGKNKIGQKVVGKGVNIYSDPKSSLAPSSPFSGEGYPLQRQEWIRDGVLKNLYTGRYWAKKTGSSYIPYPSNFIMEGSDKSVEDLIASTENGIYVNRLWYIRGVDQRQMLLTGLTRDGVFLIEDGKIKHSINNYRFNESPMNVLDKIIDMSVTEKVVGSETGNRKIVVPALKLSEFNFSTISDAV